MKKPNFFIIGAPKCGTTSLAAWLSEHPNIYMSPVKEPHFFNTDLKYINTPSRHEYERLFRGATDEHKAVGEASVFYLFSKVAVPRIEQELPGARYIVMVRNPVDMAYSLHHQQLFSGNEHIEDFAEAWHLSEERAKGRFVTQWCREPKLLDYRSVCRLGEQLQRVYSLVPRERVLVLNLEDVRKDPRKEYREVLQFLNVPDDGRQGFPVHNPAKVRRWPWLRRVVKALIHLKLWIGMPRILCMSQLINAVDKINSRIQPRPPMSLELRRELIEYFQEDVKLLEHLLDRDFSEWLELRRT